MKEGKPGLAGRVVRACLSARGLCGAGRREAEGRESCRGAAGRGQA